MQVGGRGPHAVGPMLFVKGPGPPGILIPHGSCSPSRCAQARASRSLRSRRHSRSPKPLSRCLARPTLRPVFGPDPPPSSEWAAESSSCCCSPPRDNLESGQRKVRREPQWEDMRASRNKGSPRHLLGVAGQPSHLSCRLGTALALSNARRGS